MLIRLIQIYVIGIVLMLLFLMIDRDLSLEAALEPSLLWPKTLYEMIDDSPVPS